MDGDDRDGAVDGVDLVGEEVGAVQDAVEVVQDGVPMDKIKKLFGIF